MNMSNKMSDKRSNRGFTMMEMLIAVAILVILMALGFIAVMNYQRSMKQLELDRTAQEIYVAAQNHLTQAEAEGILKQRRTDEARGNHEERNEMTYHYFFVTSEDGRLTSKSDTVLYDMLPAFSLEDTVRINGSYAIEYDLESATVTNVFYSDQSNLSEYQFNQTQFSQQYGTFFGDPGLIGSEHAKERLDGTSTDGQIIGWFGGDDAKGLTKTRLYAPKVEIINGDRLEVKVSFDARMISRMTQHTSPLMQVFVEGVTSGEDNRQLVNKTSESPLGETLDIFMVTSTLEVKDGIGYRTKTYVLDDVTQEGQHFYDLWCKNGTRKLKLGEDVTAQAKVSSNSTLANIAYSPVSAPENSLYEKLERDADGNAVAGVKSFRHLENLDPAISGFTTDLRKELGYQEPIKAIQHDNLKWSDFKIAIDKNNSESVKIHPLSGAASAAGTYLPVTNDKLVGYDGNNQYVDGVKASVSGSAGLFGTLSACSISNLELRNFTVSSTGDAAGALVGTLGGASSVTNVIAKETDGATSRISGVGAGGLIGSLAGSSTVNASAASVLVSASGPNGTAAGGLVGVAASGTAIRNSYAGGHTKDGFYDPDNFNVTAIANGRDNSAAGGLVGASQGATIENCYATTSVSATNMAGGLVGIASGTISNCYATGLVKGAEGFFGTFIGSASGMTFAGDTYYSIVNPGVPAVGGSESIEGITAFDENMDTYRTYIEGHAEPTATPYDTTLTTRYNNKYPFKTVAELNPAAATYSIAGTHVGDWPAMETLVVNARTS